MTEDNETVLTDVVDGVAVIRLNRPEKLNAENGEMKEELYEALINYYEDPKYPIMLTGAGRATCAGADIDIVGEPDFKETMPMAHRFLHKENMDLLEEYPLPTALAGKGVVAGTGFAYALCCDFIILGEETNFSYPEIKHNIAGRPERIERAVGPRLTKEIMLTGEPIPPDRAREMGLVNKVVPEDRVEDETMKLLSKINEYDTDAIKSVKEKVDSLWVRRSLEADSLL